MPLWSVIARHEAISGTDSWDCFVPRNDAQNEVFYKMRNPTVL